MTKLNKPSDGLLEKFSEIVGARYALRDEAAQAPYLSEWRDKYVGRTPVVLRPGNSEEVSQILALANEARVGIVPQSGNTGLVGGQIPFESGEEIVLSTERLKGVRQVDAAGGYMIVEAGVTLVDAQQAAAEAGALFPLSLGSEGSCRIGGNLATNAGGVQVLSYGNARELCYGLEVVLADGQIWDGLRALKKDNTGYDLKQLFIGSEGTLGIITAAVLKIHPRPLEKATAFVALPSLEAALGLFKQARRFAGHDLTAFEFLSGWALETVSVHMPGTRRPLQGEAAWYVLIEISSGVAEGSAQAKLEAVLTEGIEGGIVDDAAIAASLDQAHQLWKLREGLSEVQKFVGGSIKHDISVSVARIPEFVQRAAGVVEGVCAGARPFIFGHFGDGNIHYNVSQPEEMNTSDYLAKWDEMSDAIHSLVAEMDGSISAEHGIGRMKRDALTRFRSRTELDMMRAIKSAFDPNGILNPGKLL